MCIELTILKFVLVTSTTYPLFERKRSFGRFISYSCKSCYITCAWLSSLTWRVIDNLQMSKLRWQRIDYGYLAARRVRGTLVQSVCADTDCADTLQAPWFRTWDRSLPWTRTSCASLPGVLHSCAGMLIDIHIILLLQVDLHRNVIGHLVHLFSGSQIGRVIIKTWWIVNTYALDAHIDQKSTFTNWCEITHIHHYCADDHVVNTIRILSALSASNLDQRVYTRPGLRRLTHGIRHIHVMSDHWCAYRHDFHYSDRLCYHCVTRNLPWCYHIWLLSFILLICVMSVWS